MNASKSRFAIRICQPRDKTIIIGNTNVDLPGLNISPSRFITVHSVIVPAIKIGHRKGSTLLLGEMAYCACRNCAV